MDALGAHPLGLRLAAGLAGAPDFAGFGALAVQVADPGRDVLTVAEQLRPRLATEHSGSVAATMASSLMVLTEASRDVMMLASVLAPAPIPDDVVAEVLAAADGLQPAEAAERASVGLAACVDRCLVEAASADRGGPPQWLAHPLVLNTVRAVYRDDPRRQSVRLAAGSVLSARLAAAREQHRTGDDLSAMVPHVIAIAASMRDLDEWHLLNEAARVRVELGDSQGALEIYGSLHEHCRTVLGADDPVTLAAQVGLGVAYCLHGAHSTASRLLNQALAVLRERHGPQHPDTLTVLNDIAVVHACAGEHEAARDRYQVVHAARERTLGSWHPDTLDALYNLATAVGRCGNTDAALQLKQRVHETRRSTLGEAHERTLESLSSLAATMLALQRHDTARRMYRQVYEHRHRLPGAVAADAADNLAAAEDDSELVAQLRSEAYGIRLAVQGPGHPRTLRSLRLLLGELLRADVAASSGPVRATVTEPAQALPAGICPEDIRLDDDHMDARVELFEVAGAYYDRQLAQFGPDAVQTASAVVMLAHALAALDQFDLQFDQAWTLVDDAADGLETDLGVDHPASRAADAVRRWIAVIGPDPRPQGAQRTPA